MLKMPCGFRAQSDYVLSSVSKSAEFPSPNFNKTETYERHRTGCMWYTYTSRSTTVFGSIDFIPWGYIKSPKC